MGGASSRDTLRALRFALGVSGRRGRAALEDDLLLSVPGVGDVPATRVSPRRSRGTIVALHGLSPLGRADPRWVAATRDLAGAGFCVVSPQLSQLAALRLDPACPDRVARIIDTIACNGLLAPRGRVALFSVSFGGSVALVTAARPELRTRLTAVCAIGAFGELSSALTHVFTHQDADPYAMLVIMANYLEHHTGPWPEAREALERVAQQGALATLVRPEDHLGDVSADVRAALTCYLTDRSARATLAQQLIAATTTEQAALDPSQHLHGITAPVTLIHGAADAVVPASESERMAAVLRQRGHPVRLAVTPLLSHGDRAGWAATLREGPRALSVLAGFFADCARL